MAATKVLALSTSSLGSLTCSLLLGVIFASVYLEFQEYESYVQDIVTRTTITNLRGNRLSEASKTLKKQT